MMVDNTFNSLYFDGFFMLYLMKTDFASSDLFIKHFILTFRITFIKLFLNNILNKNQTLFEHDLNPKIH